MSSTRIPDRRLEPRKLPKQALSGATVELLRRAYEAFNARDIQSALATMHPEVELAECDGGRPRSWPRGGA